MTLKEIRIAKGFTQQKCADILNISKRKYQYLENNEEYLTSSMYQHYCEILNNFENINDIKFNTNVVLGDSLSLLKRKVITYRKRYCYQHLLDYINSDYKGKICILYGLRRTGKTTLLFQLLNDIDINKAVYIKVKDNNNMGDLVKDINTLKNYGIKYFLIDEITLMSDFINSASTLSDVYSMLGLKIIVSGTDSLGFAFCDRDELFDRNIMIHTSYIPFKEFSYVTSINDIDQYIEYGGTLKSENISFNDPDYQKEEIAFRDDESTRKYIDTAIAKNIQRTLRNNHFETSFVHLKKLYDSNELTNVINRITEHMNHEFLLSVITRPFKSSDLGSAKQLLLKNDNPEIQTALYDIDTDKVIAKLKDIIEVKEKEELINIIDEEVINQVKSYLYMLDLIKDVEVRYDDGTIEKQVVFTQPGMRYAITKALVYSLMDDKHFNSLSMKNKRIIIDKILSDIKGRMLEDIVLLERTNIKTKDEMVFKYKSIKGGEIDLVTYNLKDNNCNLYEIKHSSEISFDNQTKNFKKEDITTSISNTYGTISNMIILYKGNNTLINNIQYINVEDYLINI